MKRHWHGTFAGLVGLKDQWETLRCASIRFLDSPWCDAALDAGWTDLEIWGAFPSPDALLVRRRNDCLGLVPALVLGRGCAITGLDADGVTVSRKRTGAVLRHRRAITSPSSSVLWWDAARGEGFTP